MTPSEIAALVQHIQRQVSEMADARNVDQLSDRASALRESVEDLEGRLAADAAGRAARASG